MDGVAAAGVAAAAVVGVVAVWVVAVWVVAAAGVRVVGVEKAVAVKEAEVEGTVAQRKSRRTSASRWSSHRTLSEGRPGGGAAARVPDRGWRCAWSAGCSRCCRHLHSVLLPPPSGVYV